LAFGGTKLELDLSFCISFITFLDFSPGLVTADLVLEVLAGLSVFFLRVGAMTLLLSLTDPVVWWCHSHETGFLDIFYMDSAVLEDLGNAVLAIMPISWSKSFIWVFF
jgi:hypothetical protein